MKRKKKKSDVEVSEEFREFVKKNLFYKEMTDLHDVFSKTDWGKNLMSEIRYGRYKPAGWDNAKWEHVLGLDVNNLTHLPNVMFEAYLFLETERCFSQRFIEDVLLTAITHDWGEGDKNVKDIISDLKTEEQKAAEIKAYKNIAKSVLANFKDGKYLSRLDDLVGFVFGVDDDQLHRVFKEVVERTIELKTGLQAWRQAKQYKEGRDYLQWVTLNTYVYIPKRLELASTFLYIESFLRDVRQEISEIFTEMPDRIFDFYDYDPREKKQKIKMFKQAKKAWFASKYAKK